MLLCPALCFSQSIKISTDAPGNRIGVGETFHITIEATNCPGSMEMDKVPPGVKIVYRATNQATSSTLQGGHMEQTRRTSLILTCKGETEGSYKFGPVVIGNVKSNVISYQVTSGSGQSGSGGGSGNNTGSPSANFDPNGPPVFVGKGNEEMFLRASVNKSTAYEQEAIEYTVKLYTSYPTIKFLGAAAAPKFEGFVVEESKNVSTSFSFENYNGKNYQTAVIARYVIFPQKAGKLKVLGNTYTVSTDAEQYYHDPYFSNMTVRYPIQLNVTPNDINIEVKPLPTPKPANFTGGVGHFAIKSSMPSKTLSTNAGGALVYTVEGSGNIKYLTLPDVASKFPSSIEVYTPDVTVDAHVEGNTVTGNARFDYSIVPQEAGDFVIPALTFSYFDPASGEYKTMTTEEYHIKVEKGKSSDKSQQAMRFNPELMPVGHISDHSGRIYAYSIFYWLLYIIPAGLFVISLGIYRKYLKDHEDLTLLRSKKANKMALRRLSKAYKSLKSNDVERFYDNMLSALWGYIGDKLKMPTSELTRSNVGEEFERHNVKESTFRPIINLIDECEFAKYAPGSREGNMKKLYKEALSSLANVESEYSEKQSKQSNEESDDEGNDI